MFYVLKHALPNLNVMFKIFQTASLNFLLNHSLYENCKSRLDDVGKNGLIFKNLNNDLEGW